MTLKYKKIPRTNILLLTIVKVVHRVSAAQKHVNPVNVPKNGRGCLKTISRSKSPHMQQIPSVMLLSKLRNCFPFRLNPRTTVLTAIKVLS